MITHNRHNRVFTLLGKMYIYYRVKKRCYPCYAEIFTHNNTHHSGKIARFGAFSKPLSSEIVTSFLAPSRTSPTGSAMATVCLGCGGNMIQ